MKHFSHHLKHEINFNYHFQQFVIKSPTHFLCRRDHWYERLISTHLRTSFFLGKNEKLISGKKNENRKKKGYFISKRVWNPIFVSFYKIPLYENPVQTIFFFFLTFFIPQGVPATGTSFAWRTSVRIHFQPRKWPKAMDFPYARSASVSRDNITLLA